jgi:hypothetical protein
LGVEIFGLGNLHFWGLIILTLFPPTPPQQQSSSSYAEKDEDYYNSGSGHHILGNYRNQSAASLLSGAHWKGQAAVDNPQPKSQSIQLIPHDSSRDSESELGRSEEWHIISQCRAAAVWRGGG